MDGTTQLNQKHNEQAVGYAPGQAEQDLISRMPPKLLADEVIE